MNDKPTHVCTECGTFLTKPPEEKPEHPRMFLDHIIEAVCAAEHDDDCSDNLSLMSPEGLVELFQKCSWDVESTIDVLTEAIHIAIEERRDFDT